MANVEAEEEAPPEEQTEDEKAIEDRGADVEEPEGEDEEKESLPPEEKDPFELLDESEPDNVEEQAMYKEYLEVIKKIYAQNIVIRDLKTMATELKCKRCKTYKDKKRYKRLRIWQKQQEIHLQQLTNRAAILQNFGSRRLYGDVEMEITESETGYFLTELPSTSYPACPVSTDGEECSNRSYHCSWDSDSD